MARGRRPDPPSVKALRGTLRADRDAQKIEIVVPNSPPVMPEYLSPGAVAVWEENLGRVIAAGVKECDSDFFARYCELEASLRACWRDGMAPPSSAIGKANEMAIALGIGGPKSRVAKADTSKGNNPFARNGRRPIPA